MKRPFNSSTLHFLVLALGAYPLQGCRRAPPEVTAPDPEQVVASWSGGLIKRSEIATGYANRLAAEPGATPERQVELLRLSVERRARIELLHREALAEGLPERSDVKITLRLQAERLLAEDWLQRHVALAARASEAQVQAEVARRLANPGAETRRFGHIFLRAPAGDAASRARATETMARVRRELDGGVAFEDLARKYSDSITARGGGQVEWTTRPALHPAAAAVVFALVEGQVSDVVETEAGLQVFRLDGIRRPTPPDEQSVRADVGRTLDAEAGRAAVVAERQRVWDESGTALDARALARAPRTGETVAQVAGEPLTRAEIEQAKSAWNVWTGAGTSPPLADLVRVVVVNRLLAARRRAEPIEAAFQKRLDDATRNLVVDARRTEVVGHIPLQVTPAEIEAFYAEQRASAPFLRDHVLDLLFFAQKGASAAVVYEQGEQVSRQLRDGRSFDQVLTSLAGRALVVRRLSGDDLSGLQAQNGRLHKVLSRLAVGEVSAPVYLDGERVAFTAGKPVIITRGLVFARLAEIKPLALPRARERIRAALVRQKQTAGVAAFQRDLNAKIQLKILVDRL